MLCKIEVIDANGILNVSAEGLTTTPATPSGEPREWPQQVGLTDVILDLADVKIDLAEVLPRRVQNLLGPQSSVASTYLIAFLIRVPDS